MNPLAHSRTLLISGLVGINLLVFALSGYSLVKSRRQYELRAQTLTQNIASAVDQNVSATLQKIDLSLSAVVRDVELQIKGRGLDRPATQALLDWYRQHLPEVDGYRLTDDQGRLVLATGLDHEHKADPADRDYFIYHRGHQDGSMRVSQPVLGHIVNRYLIIFSRRYNRPDGSFAGVALATIPLEHFDQLFSRFNLGPNDMIILRGDDHRLITRHPVLPGPNGRVGTTTVSDEYIKLVDSGLRWATYHALTPADGFERTLTFHRLEGAPMVVNIGLSTPDYLADWTKEVHQILAMDLGFLVMSLLLGGLLLRNFTDLADSRQLLRTIIDSTPIRIFWKDRNLRYLGCNPPFALDAGKTRPDEVVGKDDHQLGWADRAEAYRAVDRQVLDTGKPKLFYEEQVTTSRGGTLWVRTAKLPLQDRDHKIIGLLGLYEDITERRAMESALAKSQAQLQQSQKMESLGILAGGLAHDMNNVLAAILGLASASVETQPAENPVRKAFATIIQAAERGGKVVQGLLSFARQSPVEDRELDVNGLLRDEVHLLEHTTLSRVQLELDLAPGLPPIRGDQSALTHALMNLCVNAVDAMPENGTLTLRTRRLDDGRIEVQVRDDGCGMPQEVLAKALDPFFTTKKPGKGTGLGLSMVYSTVKAHHGELELQSEPDRGTCVRMIFPAAAPAAARVESASEPQSPAFRRKLRVLLIDDDPLIQSSIQTLMEVLGHRVTASLSGEEALAQLESGLQPDVVVLDMNMPGLGGAGTLPRLRILCPTLPVLLCTGRVDQAAMDLVEGQPFVWLLAKPFSMTELQKQLELATLT
jgi:PAS domain S-box-containing protein